MGIRALDDTVISEHRRYLDAMLADVLSRGESSYSIISAHMKSGKIYDLVSHPNIVGCVTDILGENVICWGAHFFCKMPHDNKQVSWHQDASYWPLTPSKTVTVWLAIDDADVNNGCMQFIACSHLSGHLAFEHAAEEENSVLRQKVAGAESMGERVDVELKAGEISLHTDLLLHGSKSNPSDRRRCGLTLRYCAADVRSLLDWQSEGIIVSGKDVSGHWANPPRPPND